MVSKNLDIENIEFVVDELKLIKGRDGDYEILMSFNDSSKIKS